MSPAMTEMADFVEDISSGTAVLRLTGRYTLARIGDVPRKFDNLPLPPATLDLAGIERIDTVGAWVIHRLMREHGCVLINGSSEALRLVDLAARSDMAVAVHPPPFNPVLRLLNEIGGAVVEASQTLVGLLSFFGSIVAALGNILRHPSRIRVHAIVQRFDLVGVRALGIIGLMSFLIGVVIAQQGAVQLAQFGAESLTVNLIGRITTRELGVLMTAIMAAGRSGSSFAAQLGTMQLTEEIDAMRTIGVSPIEALVLPRIFAAVLMMPLLGFFATVISILGGGLLCWLSLDMAPAIYVRRLQEVIPLTDVWVGMVKAPVFGLIIAMTGCYQGLQVKGNAEEVGLKTTAAVVQAIFLVIVLDAFFAVFFTQIGWT